MTTVYCDHPDCIYCEDDKCQRRELKIAAGFMVLMSCYVQKKKASSQEAGKEK